MSGQVRGEIGKYLDSKDFDETCEGEEPCLDEMEQLLRNKLIYVVDDMAPIGLILESELRRAGCERVRVFTDGADVLTAMFGPDGELLELPDLIVSDTEMPHMSGPAMHKRILAAGLPQNPALIAMSGDPEKVEAWGDIPFLEKPFKLELVFEKIKCELIRQYDEEGD